MIVFENKGLIDIAAATTLGVNVKAGETPIGQFGTGLKCAIAVILRGGGDITIYRGRKAYVFGLKHKTIRGKPFEIVTMNGRELGFTDQYAGHWLPWMAYRELWSNCRDEGGSVRQTSTFAALDEAPPGHTTILVSDKLIEAVHDERHKVILRTEPLVECGSVEIHAGPGGHVFYRGIRVSDVPSEKRSLYVYNLVGHQYLTEDRTLAYQWQLPSTIARSLVQCTNRAVITDVLTADKEFWEHSLPWKDVEDQKPSPQFMETAEELRAAGRLKGSALTLFKALLDSVPGYASPFIHVPTNVQEHSIERALASLDTVGVHFPRQYLQFKEGRTHAGVTEEGELLVVPVEDLAGGPEVLASALLLFAVRKRGDLGGARGLAHRVLTGKWPEPEGKKTYDPFEVQEQEFSF